jgi:hypothetical protein
MDWIHGGKVCVVIMMMNFYWVYFWDPFYDECITIEYIGIGNFSLQLVKLIFLKLSEIKYLDYLSL